MGATVKARVIVGFELKLVQKYKERTKYNEDMGNPYIIQEKSHQVALCEGKEILSSKGNPDQFCEGKGDKTLGGLGIFSTNCDCYECGSKCWLGESIVESEFNKSGFHEFETSKLPKKVQDFANAHKIEPKRYLFLYHS